jgi:lipopolysaccharide transport system ATP-binding protein
MSELAIRVEHLGKQYRLGGQQARYSTFRETLVDTVNAPLRWLKGERRVEQNSFWALDDVSFEVKHGEAVGIIGRNGAGKSTLLKILSRITSPTRGRVDIYGRVGSLLEVGTGFHPELTGRENIYLNGAILGMSRVEISRKFDEIVDFAEIEKFLDTPVKHYSSGMYVRLAFAVAAHLEPEILVVDEVLAVGDAEFQKKCLGKMGDVTEEGRTVLFVSHNMTAVISLCNRAILLSNGNIDIIGEKIHVISKYLSKSKLSGEYSCPPLSKRKKLQIYYAGLISHDSVLDTFHNSQDLLLRIKCSLQEPIRGPQIAFELLDELDQCIFSSTSLDNTDTQELFNAGLYLFECPINLRILRSGKYRIRVSSSIPGKEILDILENELVFNVIDDSSPILKLGQNRRGIIFYELPWKWYHL